MKATIFIILVASLFACEKETPEVKTKVRFTRSADKLDTLRIDTTMILRK